MTETVDIHAPGVEVKKSACYFCHQNCGVLAYVKDGEVLKIEGDPSHPTNTGGLCCRGNIALLHLRHPARINHPLKRTGAKGANEWERIPWDQAIAEIAERLNQIKEESGAEAVATAGGTLRTEDWSRRRFMNLFGSPNSFHNALLCWIPTFMVETAVSGWSPFETDLGASKVLILWGVNPGAASMPGMHGYYDLQKAGLKIIVVDPRYSETAAHADIWLPLRPGSDTALALAMLQTIMYEMLYDQDFVNNWCTGFEELWEHMSEYTPEWASEITWVDAELIRNAARMYAGNKPGNIQWGCTADQLGKASGVGMHVRAIMRAITGNLDCPGGDLMPGPSMTFLCDEELEANDWLPEEQKAKQIGSDKFKLTSWPGYQIISDTAKEKWGKAPTAEWMCEAHGPSVFKAILTGDPYQVRALIVSATNPVNSYGDSKMTLEALKQVEFLVTCEYFMTSAALYSDYVMPIAGALERPTLHTNYGVTDSLLGSQRAIQPLYERHTDYTFWRDLALATGQDPEQWPWQNEEEVFYYVLYPLGLPVSSYDEFVETYRFYYPPLHYFKYGANGFATPSGRVELKSSILERLGYPALPTYVGPAENEIDDPEVAREYPLVLTTGGGFMPYHHSEHFNMTPVRFLRSDPFFTINPEKAAELRIDEGDWCWIETRRGRIKQRANVEPSVHPQVIFAQRGWWYPERGPEGAEPYGCLVSNVNVLSSVDDEHCDPIGGSWANRGLLCRVYKVRHGDEDVDTQFSIPGSSSEPGVTVPPSQQKLAYEPIPYEPPGAPFELPEGLTWDAATNLAWELELGLAWDPESGWLYHPETMVYYDLETKYAYDASTETLLDEATGRRFDMTTKQPIGDEMGTIAAEAPVGSVAEAAVEVAPVEEVGSAAAEEAPAATGWRAGTIAAEPPTGSEGGE
ncbi:MAG: molybdopterin-dependent oxidoreductase [Coriobacteriales bacterium]|nr:molybdopterin-dependent oxidoreductase [Coriobacteriales bacterium]